MFDGLNLFLEENNMSTSNLNRRRLLRNASVAAAVAVTGPNVAWAGSKLKRMATKGRIKQSVS